MYLSQRFILVGPFFATWTHIKQKKGGDGRIQGSFIELVPTIWPKMILLSETYLLQRVIK